MAGELKFSTFPANRAFATSVGVEYTRDPLSAILRERKTLSVSGWITGTSTSDINGKITAAEGVLDNNADAYLVVNGEDVHKLVDVAIHPFWSRVRVTSFQWQDQSTVEFALRRSFDIAFEIISQGGDYTREISYQNTLQFSPNQTSNDVPRTVWDEVLTGNPVSHQVAAHVVREVRMTGQATRVAAFLPYPGTPTGLVLGSPWIFHREESSDAEQHPQDVDGEEHFTNSWNYVYRGYGDTSAIQLPPKPNFDAP